MDSHVEEERDLGKKASEGQFLKVPTTNNDETTDGSAMSHPSKIDYLFEISTQNPSSESITTEEEIIGPHSFIPI